MRNTLAALALASLSTLTLAAEFPDKDLQGIIMWGAGGATDTVSRAIQPHAEEALGRDIVMTNRSGGSGAISTKFTHAKPADGYTLLFGAENPQLHKVLGLSEIDYDDFYPVNILARGIAVLVAPADVPPQGPQPANQRVVPAEDRGGPVRRATAGHGRPGHGQRTGDEQGKEQHPPHDEPAVAEGPRQPGPAQLPSPQQRHEHLLHDRYADREREPAPVGQPEPHPVTLNSTPSP